MPKIDVVTKDQFLDKLGKLKWTVFEVILRKKRNLPYFIQILYLVLMY